MIELFACARTGIIIGLVGPSMQNDKAFILKNKRNGVPQHGQARRTTHAAPWWWRTADSLLGVLLQILAMTEEHFETPDHTTRVPLLELQPDNLDAVRGSILLAVLPSRL